MFLHYTAPCLATQKNLRLSAHLLRDDWTNTIDRLVVFPGTLVDLNASEHIILCPTAAHVRAVQTHRECG